MFGNPIKRVSSQFIFPGDGHVLKRGIVETTRENEVVNLLDTKGVLPELGGQIFLNGFVIPALLTKEELSLLAGLGNMDFSKEKEAWVIPFSETVVYNYFGDFEGDPEKLNSPDIFFRVVATSHNWEEHFRKIWESPFRSQVILDCGDYPRHLLGGLFFKLQEEFHLSLHDILGLTVGNFRKAFGLVSFLKSGYKGPLAWLSSVDLFNRKLLPMTQYHLVE